MAGFSFSGRGEDRFRQLFALFQTGGEFDAADLAGGLIFLPGAAGEVAAGYAFDENRFQAFGNDGASLNLIAFFGSNYGFGINARQMIRDDSVEFFEPEVRQSRQNFAFLGDRIAEDDVKSRDTVGSDNKKFVIADSVAVTDFAAIDKRKRLNGRRNNFSHVFS